MRVSREENVSAKLDTFWLSLSIETITDGNVDTGGPWTHWNDTPRRV